MDEGKLPAHEAKFFEKVPHPFIKNNDFLETGFDEPFMFIVR